MYLSASYQFLSELKGMNSKKQLLLRFWCQTFCPSLYSNSLQISAFYSWFCLNPSVELLLRRKVKTKMNYAKYD